MPKGRPKLTYEQTKDLISQVIQDHWYKNGGEYDADKLTKELLELLVSLGVTHGQD